MSCSVEIVRENNQKTSNWSGGTTTELFIYPKDAVYSERNFKWRLSSAIVDAEESVFTSLKGIERIIMILEGELLLKHEGHYTVNLKKYNQDSFSGSWTTRSFGKVRDFNLMMAKGSKGKIEVISVDKNENLEIIDKRKSNDLEMYSSKAEAFYIVKGEVEVYFLGDKKDMLHQRDLLLISGSIEDELPLIKLSNSGERAEIIKVDIYYR